MTRPRLPLCESRAKTLSSFILQLPTHHSRRKDLSFRCILVRASLKDTPSLTPEDDADGVPCNYLVDKTELRYFIKPRLKQSTFTDASRSFIKAKLSHCCKAHRLCSSTATSGDFVPTRLLDTGASPASVVKLVRGTKNNSEYVTLSHCWGKAQIIQLKQAVEATFTDNGIPVDSLPPTFQQAVIVTRCLGIRYLWIDSLCIMQDSKQDWETESALMASVYGHGLVNIAASSSSDSRGGLFYNRDPLVVQPFATRGKNLPGLPDGWYLWKNDHRWSALSSQPLNQRGWVLQERLLSARTIHFSDTELVWHCLEDMASESVPLQVDYGTASQLAVPIMQVGDYTDMRVAMAAVHRDGLTDENKVKLHREWKRVLAHYTQCGLTNGGDKLIAIAGIVDRLEALSGDRCYAGLWRSEMPGCLLWLPEWGTEELDVQLVRQIDIPKEPVEWRAPSWSWASRDGALEYSKCPCAGTSKSLTHAEILDISLKREGNGRIKAGPSSLVIRAPIVDLDLGFASRVGEIVSRWCTGYLTSVGDGLEAKFLVRSDGVLGEGSIHSKALLVQEDWAYMFLLLQPLDPSSLMLEGRRSRFRRIGVALMVREHPEEQDYDHGPECWDFLQRISASDTRTAAWEAYIQEIEIT